MCKKGHRTLECFRAQYLTYKNNSFTVRTTRLAAYECHRYCKISKKKLIKYEADKNCRSESYFFTSVGELGENLLKFKSIWELNLQILAWVSKIMHLISHVNCFL